MTFQCVIDCGNVLREQVLAHELAHICNASKFELLPPTEDVDNPITFKHFDVMAGLLQTAIRIRLLC